jgi:hypothetical protein
MNKPDSKSTPTSEEAADADSPIVLRGWRLWRVSGAPSSPRLKSPFEDKLAPEHVTLPDDGVLEAHCQHGHAPPHADCDCGIYFIEDANTMVQWAARFGFLYHPACALTYGEAYGPFRRTIYNHVNGIPQLAASLRASSFRITAVLTFGHDSQLTRYRVPVYLGNLTPLRLRMVEHRRRWMDQSCRCSSECRSAIDLQSGRCICRRPPTSPSKLKRHKLAPKT